MVIIPAIDLRNGKVVRLKQGDFSKETTYSEDPVSIAKKWKQEGARWLHVIDLDGAKTGTPQNLKIVESILRAVSLSVELGGGIRNESSIEKALSIGVERVVIGTKALDENWIKKMLTTYRDKLIIGLDIKNRQIKTEGWTKSSGEEFLQKAKELEQLGAERLIFTDITKDGMLEGPNKDLLSAILKNTNLKVILSGGISSLDDIRSLMTFENNNFEGIIVGKALYEKKFSLSNAIKITE